MLKSIITGFASFCIFTSSYAGVQVNINGSFYEFDKQPRIAEVLEPVAMQKNWYWPNAQLFNLDASFVEFQRDEILQILRTDRNSKVEQDYQLLISEITSWRLADRIQIEIDFELARFSIAANPQFENGNYLMTLTERPTHIYVFGAIEESTKLRLPDNTCLSSVLKEIVRLDIADPDYVYLILPTGQIEIIAVAYWNKACVVAMPGSLVYVPIKEHQWTSKAKILNHKISSLALNKVRPL